MKAAGLTAGPSWELTSGSAERRGGAGGGGWRGRKTEVTSQAPGWGRGGHSPPLPRSHFQGSGTACLASGCHPSEPCCYCHFEKLGVGQTVRRASWVDGVDDRKAAQHSWAHRSLVAHGAFVVILRVLRGENQPCDAHVPVKGRPGDIPPARSPPCGQRRRSRSRRHYVPHSLEPFVADFTA